MKTIKTRIDYLNKDREVRHTYIDEVITAGGLLGYEILTIMKQGATDIRIYNLTKDLGKQTTKC